MSPLKQRFSASGIHLGLSAVVAVAAALLVFGLWYPYPFRDISGGRELFLILISVDVVIGPLITLAVFNIAKPRAELRRDLAVVAMLQLAALGYGLWTMALARPVYLVFEIDRLRVVHAVDVPQEMLPQAPAQLQSLPWAGPTMLAVRPFKSEAEKADATFAALGGVDLATRPDLWEPYEVARSRILAEAKPVTQLRARFPQHAAQIDEVLARSGNPASKGAVYLPMVGRKSFWTAVLDPDTAAVIGYLPLDSF